MTRTCRTRQHALKWANRLTPFLYDSTSGFATYYASQTDQRHAPWQAQRSIAPPAQQQQQQHGHIPPSSAAIGHVPPMGHSSPVRAPTEVKISGQNENRLKLVGEAQDVRRASGSALTPLATLILQTRALGRFTVELSDLAALQALHYVQPGTRVAVTGQLALGAGGQMYMQGQQLQMAVHQFLSGAATAGKASGKDRPPHKQRSSLYESWLRSSFLAGRSLEEMAAERGGKATRHSIASDLIDSCSGSTERGVQLESLAPHIFTDPDAGLSLPELTSFIRSYLERSSDVAMTVDGRPKMVPIRELLMQSELGKKLHLQEMAHGVRGVTFNQIKLVLEMLRQASGRPQE